ncbi:hypothetical protein [Francisella salina]|uniref:Integrase catalytic domain-containing protein n=1 Tax=Francisella salina TaxID=573569 RepID=A0ABM5M934_FRAST|nr:hypothetical protein [Francisella salina]AEI35702.1 hypothetical protein F7308_0775 [Francisella salina]
MSLEDSKNFKREIFVREGKIVAGTDYMDGMLYSFYLYKDGELLANPLYSELNHKEFDIDLGIGDYSIRFFYKFDEKAIGITESFSIVEKDGNMVAAKEANSYFVDSDNNPITKRLSKSIIQNEAVLKKESKSLDDSYPGQKFNIVIMTLPTSDVLTDKYLFLGIDDFSKELYIGAYPSDNYIFVNKFVDMLRVECPYTIDQVIIDDNIQVKGLSKLAKSCKSADIKYDLVSMEQFINNSKSLSKINELIERLYKNINIESRQDFVDQMISLTNNYNFFEKNIEVGDMTPYQKLEKHFGKV